MLIDLSLLPVLPQQSSEDTLTTDPEDFRWCTSLTGTLALSNTHMPALPLCFDEQTMPCTGVDDLGLDDDLPILDELSDTLARVGILDLSDLSGVEPDLAPADIRHSGGKPLLHAEIHHWWMEETASNGL